MTDQQPVMVAVDSVATSTSTILYAAHRARHLDRPLTLVHLVPSHHRLAHRSGDAMRVPSEHAAHQVLREAAEVAATVLPMDRITTRLDAGHPASTLAAASMHAHELVISDAYDASEGGGWTGDVVTTLVAEAPIPLTVVPVGWDGSHAAIQRIVTGIGRTDRIPPMVIQSTFDLARDHHASIEFLHVWDMGARRGETFETLPAYPGFQWNSNERIRATIEVAEPHHDDVDFEVNTYWGRPSELLRTHARGASMLVLARDPHHGPRRGHVSRPLVHHAPCPVRVLPVSWGEGGLLPSSDEPPTFDAAAS